MNGYVIKCKFLISNNTSPVIFIITRRPDVRFYKVDLSHTKEMLQHPTEFLYCCEAFWVIGISCQMLSLGFIIVDNKMCSFDMMFENTLIF